LDRVEIGPALIIGKRWKPAPAVTPDLKMEYAAGTAEIPARQQRTVSIPLLREGTLAVSASLSSVALAQPSQPTPIRVRVSNPARDKAMAACKACRGAWDKHGMAQREGCNCRTKDGGKPCGGNDCEGACLYVESKNGRPVGKCAEFRSTFGCFSRISKSAAGQPTVDPLCVD
jgi:hypothetical protein